MKQKIKNHFRKHHRLYKVLGDTLCYLIYYSAMIFIAYMLKLDLKLCVWVMLALWLFPLEMPFERLYNLQKAKEIKAFSKAFNRDVDGNFGI